MKYIHILYIFLTILALAALNACRDEDFAAPASGGEVEVQVQVSFPVPADREVLSRAQDGKLVTQIYDLMVFAFDSNGRLVQRYYFRDIDQGVTGADPAMSTDLTGSLALPPITQSDAEVGILNMRVPAGAGYLMAVANAEIKSVALLQQLLDVQTRSDLLSLQARDAHYDSDASILSGAYMRATSVSMADFDPSGAVNFAAGVLPGRIHMLSTTAAVKFNINGKGSASLGGVFTLDSYELVNLPARTPLISKIGDPVPEDSPVVISGPLTVFDETGSNQYAFDFESLEYIGTGSADIAKYGDRAAWDPSVTSAAGYKSFTNAPTQAPYVILRGTYSGQSKYVDENGVEKTGNVLADVTYFVFLGHDSGLGTTDGLRDFSTHRNWQYVYNITVNGINDITVEVNRQDDHIRDDAEGDVVVMDSNNSHRFDSHFCQSEFSITMKEVRELYKNGLLGFRVIAPAYGVDTEMFLKKDANGAYINENSTGWGVHDENTGALLSSSTEYYKKKGYMDLYNLACVSADWIRFYERTASTEISSAWLPNYSEKMKELSGNNPNMLTIYRFLWKLKSYAESSATTHPDSEVLYFTVFVHENYYEDNWNDRMVATHGASGAPGSYNIHWSQFVNLSDRKVLLFPVTKHSSDQASSFSNPRRVFSQRSIRTIYKPTTGYKAWGTESLEEFIQPVTAPSWFKGTDWTAARRMVRIAEPNGTSRKVFSTNTSMSGTTSRYARKAMFDALKGKQWTTYLNYNSKYENSLHYRISGNIRINTTSNYAMTEDMISACLGRNRDLNGNGVIDANEIRWYVPGISQLQALYAGNSGLPTEARIYQKEANEGKWVYKHYLSASRLSGDTSNSVLWAEEGLSTGQMNNSYAYGVHVRCVRDLGTDLSKAEDAWSGFYTNYKSPSGSAAGYIEIDRFNDNCVRLALENKDLSGVVTTFSNENRPAQSFYYANRLLNTGPTKTFSYTNGSSYTVPDWTSPLLTSIDTENRKSEATPQRRSLCAQNFGQGWRTPTITEVAIMYWAGVFDRSTNVLSRTRYVFWQQKSRGGIDLLNNTGNDTGGRDPHSFSEGEFRLRYPWENIKLPTTTAAGNVTQISGHYGGILCVKDKL